MIDIIEEPKPDPEIVIEQNQLINGNVKFQIKLKAKDQIKGLSLGFQFFEYLGLGLSIFQISCKFQIR